MVEAQSLSHIQWLKTIFMDKLVMKNGPPLSNSYARLIDFASGDGQLGAELKKSGYIKQNMYGYESCTRLINEAKKKNCYKYIAQLELGTDDIPDFLLYKQGVRESGFDAALSSAFLIPGQYPDTCFEKMLKTVRPGGYLIFSNHKDFANYTSEEGYDYARKLRELVERGIITLEDKVFYDRELGIGQGTSEVNIYRKVKIN